MFITAKKYFMSGNGLLESKEIKINTDDISSITECGYESRPYTGLKKVSMKNGDKFYSSISIDCKVINASTEKSYQYIKEFGEFIGADSIEYQDLGNGENYVITKDNKIMTIHVCGNRYDGGFANFIMG